MKYALVIRREGARVKREDSRRLAAALLFTLSLAGWKEKKKTAGKTPSRFLGKC
jgi:hypothetical protein